MTIVRFTARGRRLLNTVLELVNEIEDEFASQLASGEFDRLRENLQVIANRADPVGAFGSVDADGD